MITGESMYNKRQTMELSSKKESLDQIKELPSRAMPKRGISKETCEKYGVKVAVSPEDGRTHIAHYFPVYLDNEIIDYKKRDLTIVKGAKGHFTFVTGAGKSSSWLFGRKVCNAGKRVYIAEGEYDVLSCYQALYETTEDKYKSMINVCGLVTGVANAETNIAYNKDFIDSYQTVVLAFDNDRASPEEKRKGIKKGWEATGDVAIYLSEKSVKYVPFAYKDPNEYLKKGESAELGRLLKWELKDFQPEEIVLGKDSDFLDLYTPIKKGADLTCFPKLSQTLRSLREHEMTLVLAPPKCGKSSICKEIGYDLIKQGESVGHLFLEETKKITQQCYIALDNNVKIIDYMEDPTVIPKEKALESFNKLINHDRVIFLDHFGSLDPAKVVQFLKYMVMLGCKYLILDHISMVFSGSKTSDERKEIDLLLTELAAFCTHYPVHLIVVAHIQKINFTPKKDQEGNVIYPYWLPVEASHARGSASFQQLCWNLICLEPEIVDDEGTRGRTRVKLAYNRRGQTTGICDVFRMSDSTGRIINAQHDL